MNERIEYFIRGQTSGWYRGPFKADEVATQAAKLAAFKQEVVQTERWVTTRSHTVVATCNAEGEPI